MYLTEIAEAVASAINTSLPENWTGGLVLPDDLPVCVDGLDPLSTSDDTEAGIYVVPMFNEYDLVKAREGIGAGTRKAPIPTTRYLSVTICVPFNHKFERSEPHTSTPKSEWSLLSNLREDLEGFLINTKISGLKIVSVESQVPDELALDARLFMVPIIVGYKC